MKILNYCLLSTILTSSVFGQESGFLISLSSGTAQVKIDNFAVYNPVASIPGQPLGEALSALDRKDSVAVTRLTLGYVISPSWDLCFSYAYSGAAEVPIAFPLYPGMVFITSPDLYTRHVLVYKTSSFTFIPSYKLPLGDKLTLRGGLGVSYGMTAAHFENSRSSLVAGTSSSASYAKSNDTSLTYLLSLGADYRITEKISVGLSAHYTTLKAKIPTSPWANRTQSSAAINSLSAELALTWHW